MSRPTRWCVVPIRVDALTLEEHRHATESRLDFRDLPYRSVQPGSDPPHWYDANAEHPWLSSTITTRPFRDGEGRLDAGTHVHWALPDSLAHAQHPVVDGAPVLDRLEFPPVPDRWLVRRRRPTAGGPSVVDKQWLVESDYVWPWDHRWPTLDRADAAGADWRARATPDVVSTFLFPSAAVGTPPFRHVGRRIELPGDGKAPDWGDERPPTRLDSLTAVGSGDPNIAGFYPACRSVFGLHDPEVTAVESGVTYEVVGWYADPSQDPIANLLDDPRFDVGSKEGPAAMTAAVEAAFGWSIPAEAWTGGESTGPQRVGIACCGRTGSLGSPASETENPLELGVGIGTTGTEALATLVGNTMAGAGRPERREQIEAILEGVLLAEDTTEGALNLGRSLADLRHAQGFEPDHGSTRWVIAPQAEGATGDPGSAPEQASPPVPTALEDGLRELNAAQEELEAGEARLHALRRDLGLDWAKTQVLARRVGANDAVAEDDAVDLDIDLHRTWLLEKRVEPVEALVARVGQPPPRGPTNMAALEGSPGREDASLHETVAWKLDALREAVRVHNKGVADRPGEPKWRLAPTQGPRYWQPTEPAVALMGDHATPTDRHGADGPLQGAATRGPLACDVRDGSSTGFAGLPDLDGPGGIPIGEPPARQKDLPHPVFVEWEVAVRPLGHEPAEGIHEWNHVPGFVRKLLRSSQARREKAPTPFTLETDTWRIAGWGTAVPHARRVLRGGLKAFVLRRLRDLGHLIDEEADSQDRPLPEALVRDVRGSLEDDDPLAVAIDALAHVRHDTAALSFSLAGLRDSLLMRTDPSALGIDDPLAFPGQREFARERVGRAFEDRRGRIPGPEPRFDAPFLPLQACDLRLSRLRLVDSFGQYREVGVDRPLVAEELAAPPDAGEALPFQVELPPRVLQPCRLGFHWLEAGSSDQDPVTQPSTSPICGWLVPDFRDDELEVHTAGGRHWGSVTRQGWKPAPGTTHRWDDVPGAHLGRIVQWLTDTPREVLRQSSATGVAELLGMFQEAMTRIHPEWTALNDERVLLFGRPIAVVRARLGIESPEPLATQQGLASFLAALQRFRWEKHGIAPPPTIDLDDRGVGSVELPAWVGDPDRLADGVIGLWIERADRGELGALRVPRSVRTGGDGEAPAEERDPDLWLTLEGQSVDVTMLVDPHCAVHATTGMLPVKALTLPPDQYRGALAALQPSFSVGPLLTREGTVEVPLTPVPGWTWSWIEPGRAGVDADPTTADPTPLGPERPDARLDSPALCLREGWLRLSRSEPAGLGTPDESEGEEP